MKEELIAFLEFFIGVEAAVEKRARMAEDDCWTQNSRSLRLSQLSDEKFEQIVLALNAQKLPLLYNWIIAAETGVYWAGNADSLKANCL